jgi:hypothetical protein
MTVMPVVIVMGERRRRRRIRGGLGIWWPALH